MIQTFSQRLTADVASGSSVTIPYPNASMNAGFADAALPLAGQRVFLGGQSLRRYSAANAVLWNITFAAGGIQVTNGTGATWLAGTVLSGSIPVTGVTAAMATPVGADAPIRAPLGYMGNPISIIPFIFSNPEAAATNNVFTGAVASATSLTLLISSYLFARNLRIVSSNAGDTTQTVTIVGTSVHGDVITEVLTANGTTSVVGRKAFLTVTSITTSAAFTGTLSIGLGLSIGLPIYITSAADYIARELVEGSVVTNGVLTAGSITYESNTGLDAYGLYTPNTAPNATTTYQVWIASASCPDVENQRTGRYKLPVNRT